MQFQVQKNIEAHAGDLAHVVRAIGGEHLEAEFNPTELAAQSAQNGGGFFARGNVEGEDQIAGHWEEQLMDRNRALIKGRNETGFWARIERGNRALVGHPSWKFPYSVPQRSIFS